MGIYVRTRGRNRDYQFLGAPPAEFWWRNYVTVTDIEQPTILLESDGETWRVYVAGIFSQRRDTSDREIQFNLVLDGTCGDAAADALALPVIHVSVVDLAGQGGRGISGNRLDERLSQDNVERMLPVPGESTREEAAEAVRAAYKDALGYTAPDDASAPGQWIAGIADTRGRRSFMIQARSLLFGQPGRVLVLNRFLEDQYIDRLPRWRGSLGVLLARPEQLSRELGELRGKVKLVEVLQPSPGPRPPGQNRWQKLLRPRNLVLGLIGLLILIALIIWLTRGPSPSAPHTPPTSTHTPTPTPTPSPSH